MKRLSRKGYQKVNEINAQYNITFYEITSDEEFEEFYYLAKEIHQESKIPEGIYNIIETIWENIHWPLKIAVFIFSNNILIKTRFHANIGIWKVRNNNGLLNRSIDIYNIILYTIIRLINTYKNLRSG